MNVSELDKQMAPLAGTKSPMIWYDPVLQPFRLAGFPWYERESVFRRLPLMAPGELPDVDQLANCTAGGQVAFQSDSNQIAVRVELLNRANMNHMPATGQCGVDLYTGLPFSQRFHSVSKYDQTQTSYELLLFDHSDKQTRNFTLNFPLYQGVKKIQIGLTLNASLATPSPWSMHGRIVIYGTSITQGGCASRPGLAYTNILSRALNMEIINLGFSGNGRGEPEAIRLVSNVHDARLFVLDYEANSGGQLANTLPEAIRILRGKHASVPIIVVSRIAFSADATHTESFRARETSRAMQAKLVDNLRREGDTEIYFVDGAPLLGADFDECTVDGVHPNDLGFMRMARQLEMSFRNVLHMKEHESER